MKLKTKFQDEDFELGEVVDADVATMPDGRIKLQAAAKAGGFHTFFYDKLEKLYSDWEDVTEGPSCVYWIDTREERIVQTDLPITDNCLEYVRELGLGFEAREEAEKAIEKLKALTRLKDKGFKFDGWTIDDGLRVSVCTNLDGDDIYDEDRKETKKDLDICFGGEE